MVTEREIKTIPASEVKLGDEIASFLSFTPSHLPDMPEPEDYYGFQGVPWGSVTAIADDGETISIQTTTCGASEWAAECDRDEPVKVYVN